jgi:hypothetical protein
MHGRARVRIQRRGPGLLAAALVVLGLGCKPEDSERAQEVLDEAARSAERGAEQARAGMSEAARRAERGLVGAREQLATDERVTEARKRFGEKLDEAAASFTELAEAGRSQAGELGAAFELPELGIEGAAEAIRCEAEVESTRRCHVDQELLTRLEAEPKLLMREVMLLPRQGQTGRGLALVRMRPQGVAAQLGLNLDDILLEINGTSLSSLDAIRSIDEALQRQPEAELVVERAGQRTTLVIVRA